MDYMLIEVDIFQNIPYILPLEIGQQELMLKGKMGIGIQPATILPITKVNLVDCWIFQYILLVVMVELDIGPRPATLPPK